MVRFYLSMVQTILVFVSEIWVATPLIGRTLGGGFHDQGARWIMDKQPQKRAYGIWKYPPLEEATREAI